MIARALEFCAELWAGMSMGDRVVVGFGSVVAVALITLFVSISNDVRRHRRLARMAAEQRARADAEAYAAGERTAAAMASEAGRLRKLAAQDVRDMREGREAD